MAISWVLPTVQQNNTEQALKKISVKYYDGLHLKQTQTPLNSAENLIIVVFAIVLIPIYAIFSSGTS